MPQSVVSIHPIAPHPDKGGGQEKGYTKGYFSYDKESDTYRCPKGEILSQPVQKRALGFTYFLTRGTENVRTESLLHFLAYNTKRLINIVGTNNMRLALQG